MDFDILFIHLNHIKAYLTHETLDFYVHRGDIEKISFFNGIRKYIKAYLIPYKKYLNFGLTLDFDVHR